MGSLRIPTATLLILTLGVATAAADEAEIKAFFRGYVDAFNRRDAAAIAALWSEDASHVDHESGARTDGRAAIAADLAESLARPDKPRLAGEIARVRFVKPDVASVEGTTETSVPGEEPSLGRFTALLVKEADGWKIASLEETDLPRPPSAGDALRELAWLEGTWIDESKEPPVVSTIRWSPRRTFLIRTFAAAEGEETTPLGTQVIGWDPRARRVRSWTFNADGSFGDGVWEKTGEDWSIESTQTLADGRAASGVYVVTPRDADSFTLRLVGHEIDGEPVPAAEPVVITRVPAEAAATPDSSTPDAASASDASSTPAPAGAEPRPVEPAKP